MSSSVQLLILAGGLYCFSLLVAFLLQRGLKKFGKRPFAIPYDRLPIGIAIALLVVTAGVLASGNEAMANDLAVMAYYLLVLGVFLLFIDFIREQRRVKRTFNSKNAVNYPNSEEVGNHPNSKDAANHLKSKLPNSGPPNG